MSEFKSLMRRADHARRLEDDHVKSSWWTGYMRGLRRAHHGDNFGTLAEHEIYINAALSDNPLRAALGNGYQSGLKMQWDQP